MNNAYCGEPGIFLVPCVRVKANSHFRVQYTRERYSDTPFLPPSPPCAGRKDQTRTRAPWPSPQLPRVAPPQSEVADPPMGPTLARRVAFFQRRLFFHQRKDFAYEHEWKQKIFFVNAYCIIPTADAILSKYKHTGYRVLNHDKCINNQTIC